MFAHPDDTTLVVSQVQTPGVLHTPSKLDAEREFLNAMQHSRTLINTNMKDPDDTTLVTSQAQTLIMFLTPEKLGTECDFLNSMPT